MQMNICWDAHKVRKYSTYCRAQAQSYGDCSLLYSCLSLFMMAPLPQILLHSSRHCGNSVIVKHFMGNKTYKSSEWQLKMWWCWSPLAAGDGPSVSRMTACISLCAAVWREEMSDLSRLWLQWREQCRANTKTAELVWDTRYTHPPSFFLTWLYTGSNNRHAHTYTKHGQYFSFMCSHCTVQTHTCCLALFTGVQTRNLNTLLLTHRGLWQ